ncbi:MAG: hypothetical protein BWY64_03870 [bacterium ADurb.Bin363]|nr:MAG: hypothetical protein BWY64_03870 [bacterium ADurb.Bin363]
MNNNNELHILHEAIFGQKLQEVSDEQIILKALKEGKSDIIMSLLWEEEKNEEYHEWHKVVIQGINEKNRIVFYNPLGHSENIPAGTIIEGEKKGPPRVIEGTGLESVSIEDFMDFFKKRKAVCFLPV